MHDQYAAPLAAPRHSSGKTAEVTPLYRKRHRFLWLPERSILPLPEHELPRARCEIGGS